MIALDFGADAKLCLHGASGPVPVPAHGRGLTAPEKFASTLESLLEHDDVVTESPTVGSSGAEPELVRAVVENAPHSLFLLPARAVKNYGKDIGSPTHTDEESAEWLYELATENPDRMKVWRPVTERLQRVHTSVRPWDKRGYKGDQVDEWMDNLPPFAALPEDLAALFGNGKKRAPDYKRTLALPYAMAMTEPDSGTRKGFEKIIGLYGHGFPSFYRKTNDRLLEVITKSNTGKRYRADITPAERKEAWRELRRMIRKLYHLAREHALSR